MSSIILALIRALLPAEYAVLDGWREDGRKHTTIRNHDSPGVRQESALRGSRGFWAVSFWLDVVADVGRLCGMLSH